MIVMRLILLVLFGLIIFLPSHVVAQQCVADVRIIIASDSPSAVRNSTICAPASVKLTVAPFSVPSGATVDRDFRIWSVNGVAAPRNADGTLSLDISSGETVTVIVSINFILVGDMDEIEDFCSVDSRPYTITGVPSTGIDPSTLNFPNPICQLEDDIELDIPSREDGDIVPGVWSVARQGAVFPATTGGVLQSGRAPLTVDVSDLEPGPFVLTFTPDQGSCTEVYQRQLTITEPPSAGDPTLATTTDPEFCIGEEITINLNDRLTDEDPGGTWFVENTPGNTEDELGPEVSNIIDVSTLPQGSSNYVYVVGQEGCINRSSPVVLRVAFIPEIESLEVIQNPTTCGGTDGEFKVTLEPFRGGVDYAVSLEYREAGSEGRLDCNRLLKLGFRTFHGSNRDRPCGGRIRI